MSSPAKKVTKPKAPASHPKYIDMINEACATLKERGGSSRQAITKFITNKYSLTDSANSHIKLALRKAVLAKTLIQTKGTGASGSYKCVVKAPAPKKKPVAKKAKTPKKAVKKPAAKKTKKSATKKPAAKKPAAKKPAAKKPAAKKPAAKKPAAKKPAAKKPATKKPAKKAAAKK